RRRGWGPHGYGLAAFRAELHVEPTGRTTARASSFETRPAFLAKHRVAGVRVVTPGTLHPGLPIGGPALRYSSAVGRTRSRTRLFSGPTATARGARFSR